MEFKMWLRNKLIEKNFTQEEFGRLIGVSGPAVNNWVQGRQKPTINRAIKIADALSIPQEDILFMLGYISKSSSGKVQVESSGKGEAITPADESKQLDQELDLLCRKFEFLLFDKDNKIELSNDTKKGIIGFFKFVLNSVENKPEGGRKE